MEFFSKANSWFKARNEVVKFAIGVGVGYTFNEPISLLMKMIASIVS